MSYKVLIVDDEKDKREALADALSSRDFEVFLAKNSDGCFAKINKEAMDAIILDLWLDGSELNGIEILEKIKEDQIDSPVIMMTSHSNANIAMKATNLGAYDFLEKPLNIDKLILTISRAIELKELKTENRKLSSDEGKIDGDFFIGSSNSLDTLLNQIDQVACSNSRVFITGGTGVGKTSVAKLIHDKSNRADSEFVVINCAAMNKRTLDEALFGKLGEQGLLEKAQGGTLFLNEVADMSEDIQSKMSAFLLQDTFSNAGVDKEIKSDCRVICSTEKNMEKLIAKGAFRQDLFYRLNVVPITVPSLHERIDDIPELANAFLCHSCKVHNLPSKKMANDVMPMLQRYSWQGNVMQLKNVCESIVIMTANSKRKEINKNMLPDYIIEGNSNKKSDIANQFLDKSLKEARAIFEKKYLEDQLERFSWNISKTAKFVGMERSALHKKMKVLNVKNTKPKGK